MFGDIEPLRRAISSLRVNGYAKHNDGKLGVWYSRRALLVNGSYCFCGSEYLNILSQEMGPSFHQEMTTAGIGAIIRCHLPIDMAESYCASLAELVVKRLFQIVNPDAPESIYLDDHAPMLEHDIPPEWIDIEFLPA
ncbi:MAG: hypothetical protein JWM32_2770 [Verrucomicrobia bacterium]|nr:hypothetical protein [Verrucomicrobiota bacterium]